MGLGRTDEANTDLETDEMNCREWKISGKYGQVIEMQRNHDVDTRKIKENCTMNCQRSTNVTMEKINMVPK